MGGGKRQGQRGLKVRTESFFPGAIIIVKISPDSPQEHLDYGLRGQGESILSGTRESRAACHAC
jgi:hypothetical protein